MDNIFAYETNGKLVQNLFPVQLILDASPTGFGGRYVMDDANVPVSCDDWSKQRFAHSMSCSLYFLSLTLGS